MTESQRITAALGGKWYRRYGVARCPAHGDRRPSLTLSDGPNGRLLAHCKTGCSFADVLAALRGLGIVEAGRLPQTDPAELARYQEEQRREAEKKARQALGIWTEAQPIGGTVAETYLRGRGITCPLPETLRFHPECWHGATAKRLPAMVARIDGAEGFAVHRTYLAADGSGKAQVDPAKAMLGAVAGGAVRLTEGHDALAVAEGIETALSLSCGLLEAPTTIWAALSAPGLRALRLPPQPGVIIIATDNDAAGIEAGQDLARRAYGLRWSVSTLTPPEGVNDWNDYLRGGAA